MNHCAFPNGEKLDKIKHTGPLVQKHILVISQYFYPESFRINDICCEWVKRGYQVTVVTGIPNYPEGKFFPGYGWTKRRRETWNGVEIIRIPLFARGSNSIGMVLNYFSFALFGLLKMLFTRVQADYVFTFGISPMTQALVGCIYAQTRHVPHYLYVQDLWPENVIAVTGLQTPAVIKPIDLMMDFIYKKADVIFTTSPSFVDAICERKQKVDRAKVHYWPQYAEDFYHPSIRKAIEEIPVDGNFKVIYTGNFGYAQGLQILPAAAELLKEDNICFVMIGAGRYLPEFQKEIQKRGVEDQFILIPKQPMERIPELLAACDAAFLSFQNQDIWAMTIPAKLQSYMACAMPVIAVARGETQRIIEQAKCGVCCQMDDPEGLAAAIRDLSHQDLSGMARCSRAYFEAHFRKKTLMDQIEHYFQG